MMGFFYALFCACGMQIMITKMLPAHDVVCRSPLALGGGLSAGHGCGRGRGRPAFRSWLWS
eukprot:21015-Prymnesium_polylepis.1